MKPKKILAMMLAVVMVIVMVPVSVSAEEFTDEYYTYTVTDGEAEIVDVDTAISGDVVIPDMLGGYPVTGIGREAFYTCRKLTSVIVPMGVTYISHGAFESCRGLTSIDMPNSVKWIGERAFYFCTNLVNVFIPDSVTWIGNNAFYWCETLTSVTISDSVTYIGDDVFTYTGYYNDSSNWENGVLYVGKHLIKADLSISGECEIKNGTLVIAVGAFEGCEGLTGITIPNSVTSIGESAFVGTGYYNDIENWENDVLYIGKYLIKAKSDISGEYSVKKDTLAIAGSAFSNCDNLTKVTMPDSVKSIGIYAFSKCKKLTNIPLPNSVTWIGDYAFYWCDNLINVVIPDGVTDIADGTFECCDSLTSVVIPDSVTSIGVGVFSGCEKITIHCNADSYAATYAIENKIPYKIIGMYTLGDVTGDDTVNLADVTLILKYIAKWDITFK